MDITQEIVDAFRLAYPSFTVAEWDDAVVTQALCEGDAETGGRGWGGYVNECHNFKQRGMFLYTAHWLATTYPNGYTTAGGGNMSGGAKYGVQSKSVGDESITNAMGNMQSAMFYGDAWLMSTAFGQQFVRLRRRAGMGARAV